MSAEHVFQMGSRRKSVKNDMAVWSVESICFAMYHSVKYYYEDMYIIDGSDH
jgi:hypothetical protein